MSDPTDRRNPANVSVERTAICRVNGHRWKLGSPTCIRCGLHYSDWRADAGGSET